MDGEIRSFYPNIHDIHVIGDSHVCFFSGKDEIHPKYPDYIGYNSPFKTYRLGASLAYNLCISNTSTNGRENLFSLLQSIPKQSIILLVYGEIDCRAHIGKQANMQNRNINDTVKECVSRYFGVILEVKNMGFNTGVWNVIPSTDFSDYAPDHPFPCYGDWEQRNYISKLFNICLSELCIKNKIIFIDIFNKLLNIDGTTNLYYYLDPNHLSQKAFSIAYSEITVVFKNHLK